MSSDSDRSIDDLICIHCGVNIHDLSYAGICGVCSESVWDVMCISHLMVCDDCGENGCEGCNSVGICQMCFRFLCNQCMGGSGACEKCGKTTCEKCLVNSLCDMCLLEETSSDE